MVRPQLTRIEEMVKIGKKMKLQHHSPAVIMVKLETIIIKKYGLSRTTREDYLKIVKVRLWQ